MPGVRHRPRALGAEGGDGDAGSAGGASPSYPRRGSLLEYKENETIVTEPAGGKLTYGFDGQDRVISEKDQLGHTTTTSYDEAGNVDEIVKPGGAKWQFGHDGDGNLTSVIDPEEGERGYEYDGQNRLTEFTDERGETWAYEWSEANDLKKCAPNQLSSEPSPK